MRRHVDSLEVRILFAITFADPTTYPIAGDALTQPALADFNGDGFLDAATCHTQAGQNSVSVLLNQGNGTFATQTPIAVGQRPYQVVAGEFNNDAKPDLACTNVVDGTVSVLLGNGDGTFQPKIDTVVGTTASVGSGATEYLAVANLNHDGFADLVVNNNSEQKLQTLLGVGDGTFTPQDAVTFIGTSAGTIAVGDVSGDGLPDVVTNLGNDQSVVAYFGDASGNLDDGHTLPIGNLTGAHSAEGVAVADLNQDSKSDIAVLSIPFSITEPGVLSVFISNADGTFQNNTNTQLTIAGLDLSLADMDSDGIPDAVVSQALTGFQVLKGNGDGTFATPAAFENATFAVSGAAGVGDLNNDDKPDLAFDHFTPSTDTLGVFLAGTPGGGGGGEGTATATPTLAATLPDAVVAGAKVKGAKVSVAVANQGTAVLNEPVTVELFASTDTTIDGGDTAVGTPLVKKLRINPASTKIVKIKVATIPTVPDGDYYLLARTSAASATGGESASTETVNIAAPFVDLNGAYGTPLPTALIIGKRATVPLVITNSGNVAVRDTINVALAARPQADGSDIPIPTIPVKINIKPGASKTVRLRITADDTLGAGPFNFFASIDSPSEVTEKIETNNDVLSTETFSVVLPS